MDSFRVRRASATVSSPGVLRVGFVPLIDAAPLIVARELGYFADEGLKANLERQIGWGNVRDKLTFGHLDASHALAGMPVVSILGRDQFAEPLVALCPLGSGGNAITLSRRLAAMGVTTPAALGRLVRSRAGGRPLAFAHVFGCSAHHYLLRRWLAEGDIDPDAQVRLCVLPPPQMHRQLGEGHLDGFCAGEPWNTAATESDLGVIVPAAPAEPYPDKVVAVQRRWLERHRQQAERMVAAVARGRAFCEDPANASKLAEMLAARQYLDTPVGLLARSLATTPRGCVGPWRRFSASSCDSQSSAEWILRQMARWGHLPPGTDARSVADLSSWRAAGEPPRVDRTAGVTT